MIEWLVLVIGAAGVAGIARATGVRRRGRRARQAGPDRMAPAQLGLERFPPQGAFVQFSPPYSSASRVSLNRLAEASAHHPGRVTIVEIGGGPAHARLGSRPAPMVVYVDAAGVVRRRWTAPPERAELVALLREDQEPAAAGSAEKSFAYSSATRSSSVAVSSGVPGAAANSRSC
jgi:hypothetical protein